jgi:2-polyprenyl-3-methyl-5-hydroxy-6-metoxy-1,4-benzoquinol methylase
VSSKKHEQVNEFFDGYSEKWDSLYGKERKKDPLSKFADEVLRAVIKRRLSTTLGFTKSDKIKTILDAGCGSGQYVVEFAKQGKLVTGLDFAESMLKIAKKSIKDENLPGVDFMQADFVEHDFSKKYDAVCAMGFFDYIENPAPVLKKMVSISNHEVYASFPKAKGILALQRRVRYKLRSCPLWLYSEKRLLAILEESGVSGKYELVDLGRDWIVRIKTS